MTDPRESLIRGLESLVENVVLFDVVDSTHAVALRLIEQTDSEGLQLRPTVVVADRQTRGVGRGSRRWVSPPGGLYLNWIATGIDEALIGRLPMLAASAALKAIIDSDVPQAAVKWPNDILVEGRKLAGILVHVRRSEVICCTVALGVNVEPLSEPIEDALQPPTSLAELLGAERGAEARSAVATGFVRALEESLSDPEPALERWRTHLVHALGDVLSVRLGSGEVSSGTFAGLTAEGYIRLADDSGRETVITGGDVIE